MFQYILFIDLSLNFNSFFFFLKKSLIFFSFKKLYPEFIYPGGTKDNDPEFSSDDLSNVNIKKTLNFYNPITEKLGQDCSLLGREYSKKMVEREAFGMGGIITKSQYLEDGTVEMTVSV